MNIIKERVCKVQLGSLGANMSACGQISRADAMAIFLIVFAHRTLLQLLVMVNSIQKSEILSSLFYYALLM